MSFLEARREPPHSHCTSRRSLAEIVLQSGEPCLDRYGVWSFNRRR